MDKQKCDLVYWNLIKMFHVGQTKAAPFIVRELFEDETIECDKFNDLQKLRKSMREHMGEKTLQNIRYFTENQIETAKTVQCVVHHRIEAEAKLVSGLSFADKLYYHTLFKLKF